MAPIFVVGPPRCGTTLTARILGLHSRIFMPGETHFFPDIYANRQRLGNLNTQATRDKILERLMTLYDRYNEPNDQDRIDNLLGHVDVRNALKNSWTSYKDVLSSFMEMQARMQEKSRWGNNTPRDLFHLKEILEFYPDAKIILCCRDPRDFLVSYRDRWKTTSPVSAMRVKQLYHPIMTSMLWKASARRIAALSLKTSNNVFFMRYEKLVSDPEAEIRAMCMVIEEDFEFGMLQIETNNSSVKVKSRGIFSSSVGRWRSDLSDAEVWIAQLLTRGEMQTLDYSLVTAPLEWRRVIGYFLTLPGAVWRGLAANREMRGPLAPYLMRRAISLFGG